MAKNIKVELIYFACAKDFEFEFNLCSACQIRLLTDNPDTIEALPLSLAKGVGRSQVIIITGLYSDQMVDCIASSIGFNTSTINCEEYQISSAFAEKIIDGALPLVTTGGKYVGLILESGPQTLILLSADKSSRKEIMTSLIQPYIADLSRLPENFYSEKPTSNNTVMVEETAIIDEADSSQEILEDEQESYLPETKAEEEIEDVFSDNSLISTPEAESEEDEDEEVDLSSNAFANFDQEDFERFKDDLYNQDTYNDEKNAFVIPLENPYNDEEFLNENVDEVLQAQKKKNWPGILTIILLFLLFLLLGFVLYALVIEPIINGVPLLENLKQTFGFLLQ